jgi:beta-galactosidase
MAFSPKLLSRAALLALLLGVPCFCVADSPARPVENFDAHWRFLQADVKDAAQPSFDDAKWRSLDLPHDWSIEGPFAAENPAGGAGAFLPTGIGWYRKHFALPATAAGQRVFIEFDGVMANSDVWINGTHLGQRPNGYVSFRYELTGHLNFGEGKSNVLAVRVNDEDQPASRWYAGAGIYRPVHLIVTNSVHFAPWATFVSTPYVSLERAVVRVQTTLLNQSSAAANAALEISLLDPRGTVVGTVKSAAQKIPAGKSAAFDQQLAIEHPALWDENHPQLYRAKVEAISPNGSLDAETVSFGVRKVYFAADTGFWINGRNLKLKGVCLHDDAGALGTAVPHGTWERRLKLLKQMGVNAIRTSHNPVAPEFLDLCDRLGFFVLDEMFDCWTYAKNPFDYHLDFAQWAQTDVRDTVRRDRNHPSIVIYSAGNEIHDTRDHKLAKKTLTSLLQVFHESDPTRPVTQALFRPNASHDYQNGLADLLDVVGQNYREQELLNAHLEKPTRKIIGTENNHSRVAWLALRDHSEMAGQFLWTGFDYLGESKKWPDFSRPTGIFDRTGYPHVFGLQRESWWSNRPVVHLARRTGKDEPTSIDPGYEHFPKPHSYQPVLYPDWNPANRAAHTEDVEVYSNCAEVELFLNGKSLGAKPLPADASPRTWNVQFAPGSLQAVGRNAGKIVASEELKTAGKPAKILLTTDQSELTPDWNDVAYVTATVVDENGVLVPTAGNLIAFQVQGPGLITAVDNGSINDHDPFQASQRHAFEGRCVAIVKASLPSGKITITARAANLAPATLQMETKAAPAAGE